MEQLTNKVEKTMEPQPITLSCYAVGSVYGTLDVDNHILTTEDLAIKVNYNKSFGSWLLGLTEEEKEVWKATPQTYPALPRTYRYPPYISYELIGVNRQNQDKNGYISVLGEVINHNPTYKCALIRVHKRPEVSFVLKIEGDFDLNRAEDESTPLSDLTGCWVQVQAQRVGNVFALRYGRILATKDQPVKLSYSYREDYFTFKFTVEQVHLEEDCLLAKPFGDEDWEKINDANVSTDNGLVLVKSISASFRYSNELADYFKNFSSNGKPANGRILKAKVRVTGADDQNRSHLKCKTLKML
ncbi:MAG: hypothetical protein D6735_06265 [Acidobacteria bacterium]|jgi:hypothetical protein|nr:MAG: hypothetical protein D6735_06265 [Acidobacteriota bacterium]